MDQSSNPSSPGADRAPAQARRSRAAAKITQSAGAATDAQRGRAARGAAAKTGGSAAAAPAKPRKATRAAAPAADREISVGTDAATAPAAPVATSPTLRNMSQVRHFFRTNDVPIFFVGATPFNLLGLDRWVRGFSYITYYDGWDGEHPRVFTPTSKPYIEFESGEEINNWLLRNPETRAHIARSVAPGVRPKVCMVFLDEETEQICAELGYDLILPSAALRERLDSKLETTRLGEQAGVPSVPNVLTTVDSWASLLAAAEQADLGQDLVVQTAYGDSGKTTYFLASEQDWERHAESIRGEQVKVMKRISHRPVAVEAVLTRCGTVVGPFMSELTGHAELTPYRGGWCGNEMYPEVLAGELRADATQMVRALGERLAAEGYRGFFEVDLLVDTDTDTLYLGELNPRISGASAITHVTAGAYADVPLFLFHLLEFLDTEFDLDVEEINQRWAEMAAVDMWSQMIIKETGTEVELLERAAPTGQYRLDEHGALVFSRPALDWHQLQSEAEAFYLRIYGPGDYRWKGADLGVLITRGRLESTVRRRGTPLTIRARHLVDSIRSAYGGTPLVPPAQHPPLADLTTS